jgi:sodium pump decarboxylase gamma subunit
MTILNNGITNSMIFLTLDPLGERMKMALLNTVLGMGIVFAVLILIILFLSLFKFLPNSVLKDTNHQKAQNVKVSPVDNVIAQIVSQEESNLINDHELVAVITAAICEFSCDSLVDTSAGGFVVRSIRKINNRRIS